LRGRETITVTNLYLDPAKKQFRALLAYTNFSLCGVLGKSRRIINQLVSRCSRDQTALYSLRAELNKKTRRTKPSDCSVAQ
jgi:hypothetical protein